MVIAGIITGTLKGIFIAGFIAALAIIAIVSLLRKK